jgi:ubiquitin-protein ligase
MSHSDNEENLDDGAYMNDDEDDVYMSGGDEDYEYCSDGEDDGMNDEFHASPDAKSLVHENHFDYFISPLQTFRDAHPHVESVEFRQILQTLKYVMKHCHSYKLSLDWEMEHPEKFRYPSMTVTSRSNAELNYFFVLNFRVENGNTFPEYPPRIIPNFSMPPSLYLFTVNFPLLSLKHWNPCQDFVGVFEILFALWDQVLRNYPMYEGTIAGGDMTEFPLDKAAIQTYTKRDINEVCLEVIVALWYELFQYECGYEFKDIQEVLNGLVQQPHEANGDNNNQLISTSMHSVLAACPKSVEQKQYLALQGVGYSTGVEKSAKRVRTSEDVANNDKLTVQFANICCQKLQHSFSQAKEMQRILKWIFASPLLHIVDNMIGCLSPGDALRNAGEILSLLKLAYLVDTAIEEHRRYLEVPPTVTQLLKHMYLYAKKMWVDTGLLVEEEQEDPAAAAAADDVVSGNTEELTRTSDVTADNVVKHICQFSELWKEVVREDAKVGVGSTSVGENGGAPSPGSSSSGSSGSSSSSIVVNNPAADHTSSGRESSRVVFVEGLEREHAFTSESAGIAKCPKFFLRELKTFEDSLPKEITLFVSERSPHLLRALMYVTNDDCPYFGGSYLFDIIIPADYPNVHPKVKYLTTGRGTVRFNPNLYHCGKVCLSLLGTWQGEPWDPKTSNMTQVLNSILFLIFTKDPYFNEPGYSRNEGTLQASGVYDGNLFPSVVDFGIKDYFTNPPAIVPIRDCIHQIYRTHWQTTILPLLRKKQTEYESKNQLKANDAHRVSRDLQEISRLVAQLH